jgi:hypothetical protein
MTTATKALNFNLTTTELRAAHDEALARKPELEARLWRALGIVSDKPVAKVGPGTWQVESGTGNGVYTVTQETCTCPDFPKAPLQFCKHRLAVVITRKALFNRERQEHQVQG